MSEKTMKSMKDENSDLQKQIGCIAGFFQLFDRHRFLSSHIQQRTSGGSSSNDIKELNNNTMQKAKARSQKVAKEKQQFSTESSITSMSSSSCSSSMSSLEFNRTIQPESIKLSESQNSELATKKLDEQSQKSLDFHEIVKDSMHREAQGLSVRTLQKEQNKGQTHTLKYIDSPRPLQPHKSVNAGVMVSNEAFHNLAKSKKTPWDFPRLSYDGRYAQDTIRTATKHKELLPRLSLDSKEGSIRGFNEGNKSRNLLTGPQKGYVRNSSTMLNQLEEPDTSRRSSSVVAKLMGLEAFPDSTQTCETPPGTTGCCNNKNELLARSRISDEYKQSRSSVSPRSCPGFTLPQSRRADSSTTATPYSRFALETSPWRQPDSSQSSQLQVSKGSESDVKASKSSSSVYGEIEKRLSELEFKRSGKDLRALKQILEAMQRYKDSSDSTSDQASNSPSHYTNSNSLNQSSKVQSPRIRQKDQTSVTNEISNASQDSKLPIVIIKSAKVTRKANAEMLIHGKSGLNKCYPGSNPTNGRLVDKQTSKGISSTIRNAKDPCSQPIHAANKSNNMRTSKSMQSLKVPQDSNRENTNSGNVTVTSSPRLQKKFGLERRSPPSSPSSDCSISRRQHNRNSLDLSSSPNTTPRQKFSTLQERSECFGENSCHWRDLKHRVNVISPDFDSKRSLHTYSDIEIIRINQSGKINSNCIELSGLDQNIAVKDLSKGRSKTEITVTTEQPSPVSVLDAAFYREDPPSPVRKKSHISEDSVEVLSTYDDSEENSVDLPLSNTEKANFNTGSGDRDSTIQSLVQMLQEFDVKLNSFSDSKDSDHKYIAEILLASGLLSGPASSHTSQSPPHLINPKLFFALEQMKTRKRNFYVDASVKKIGEITNLEQMQRKLIFDVVNDILFQKSILESCNTLWCLPNELSGRRLKGKQRLDELCTEIDQLQPPNRDVSLENEDENLTNLIWRDLVHHSTLWTNCCIEMPNVVLDIERSIFKDLITEVVRGEVANSAGRYCRQLVFPN